MTNHWVAMMATRIALPDGQRTAGDGRREPTTAETAGPPQPTRQLFGESTNGPHLPPSGALSHRIRVPIGPDGSR